MADDILFREMTAGDVAYVFRTTLSHWRNNDTSPIPDNYWFPAARALLEDLLMKREITALIMCPSDQPTEILGYIIAEEGKTLWQTHVRKSLLKEFPELQALLLKRVKLDPKTCYSAWRDPVFRNQSRKLRRSVVK